jgi:hypothetical protein
LQLIKEFPTASKLKVKAGSSRRLEACKNVVVAHNKNNGKNQEGFTHVHIKIT